MVCGLAKLLSQKGWKSSFLEGAGAAMVAEARQEEQLGGHSLDVAGFLQEKGPGHLDGGGLLCVLRLCPRGPSV